MEDDSNSTANGQATPRPRPTSQEPPAAPSDTGAAGQDEKQHDTFDSLNILSELASSAVSQQQHDHPQEQEQQQLNSISDNAFQALLLASLSDQFPTHASSSSSSSSHASHKQPAPSTQHTAPTAPAAHAQQLMSQHQHAQDLLSALSALQTTADAGQLDPPGPPHDMYHHHHHQELDFDDPTLFSPFDADQEQMASQQQPVQQQHQDLLSHLDSQLDLYSLPALDDHDAHHHQFDFLFDNDYQAQQQQQQQQQPENDPYYLPHQPVYQQQHEDTDDLLARLDEGIRNTQQEIALTKLDAVVEHSLSLNQDYLEQIKKTLANLALLHAKARHFLTVSKQCVDELEQQQQQQQPQPGPLASSSRLPPPPGYDPTAANLALVSDQVSAISLPWFKHKFGVDLPSFDDARKREQYNGLLHNQPWQPPERRKLDEEVAGMLRVRGAEKGTIDWARVALNFPDRKPIECKIQWTQKQDPALNKAKWTAGEIDQLFEIVKKFEHKRWDRIAQELGTGRTASECVKQFRIVTQEKREWTETDDLLLKEGVSTYGQNWQAVANHCGRSSNQCINRWSKTLRPDIKKGKWDPVEDEALKSAVAACGMVWKDVAPRVRGRTDAQCRERWCNILDPRIVVGNWSAEEDSKILRMRDVERKTWSEISKSFDGRRTDNHVSAVE
ncbi:hypothetical protein PtA15_18A210 [Puccinia triticina]|uniref:Uncharacterized protein n=1 Tax=Puccinia triticina TaxID=208348 RepID=A0ABY7DA10_9BASI|nr:uncharacterized protein PtA15_18A210 [Puccinia triticina]WAQ93152.1 hypothetical protein PtA15_18A210 [Puccinia triticina]